jgi:hypothetical protein
MSDLTWLCRWRHKWRWRESDVWIGHSMRYCVRCGQRGYHAQRDPKEHSA